jgi:hypothetical protein
VWIVDDDNQEFTKSIEFVETKKLRVGRAFAKKHFQTIVKYV